MVTQVTDWDCCSGNDCRIHCAECKRIRAKKMEPAVGFELYPAGHSPVAGRRPSRNFGMLYEPGQLMGWRWSGQLNAPAQISCRIRLLFCFLTKYSALRAVTESANVTSMRRSHGPLLRVALTYPLLCSRRRRSGSRHEPTYNRAEVVLRRMYRYAGNRIS